MSVTFNYDVWFTRFNDANGGLFKLKSYLNDKQAYTFHMENSWSAFDLNGEEKNILYNDPDGKATIDMFYTDIQAMKELISNQFIVYNATLVETLFYETFYLVFMENPKKINNIIFEQFSNDKDKLGLTLNELLDHDSKESYIETLCEKAASLCNGGKFKDSFKRLIRQLNAAPIDQSNKNIIIDLVEKRNSIVHENNTYELEDEYFRSLSESTYFLLDYIRDNMNSLGIPIIDTINNP
ncbi:hypothetical protein [Paenibacillus sacheonensis]|uniref:RiboL-PSP-HEPN domain-containing protein n=1 Tax=Paenibacillus sacheonensis TaxID=742054 RepID=A0A7X5C242_9BACL|nr:hypothetical protein [Paenibacillus sacheonensis]MBM7564310.1 hypothetical protein [Paenibacillus sacheonensis]NBC73457.1 hypothetical protein [Paenibacillus sacheonensis]